jgi:glycosidase
MNVTQSPADWRDGWIYFLMIDRFNNPSRRPAQPWDAPYQGFQGGTLPGVTAQLDYIRDLGAGAVWLSPVLQNMRWDDSAYHGYGIQNFTRVEPRFCADEARARADASYADSQLRELVDAAHERGLHVILDIVLNHAGDVFAYDGFGSIAPWRDAPTYPIHWRQADGTPNPGWADAPLVAAADEAVHPDALRRNDAFRRLGDAMGRPNDESTLAGDFSNLKELVTDLPDDAGRRPIQDALIDSYADVIARFDVDGFRIDTLMYVDQNFARVFGNAMREHAESLGKSNFFTFGEVWSDEKRISGYVGRHVGDGGLIGVDAALDFPLFYLLQATTKGLVAPQAIVDMYATRRALEDGVISSHGDATNYFVTFADNHDCTPRLRYEDPAEPHRFDDQVSLTLAVLLTLPGVPCVYYGTESGLSSAPGTARELVRQALWGAPGAFDPAAQPFAPVLRQLSALRARQPALRYGRHYFRPISGNGTSYGHSPFPGGVVAFSRLLAVTEVIVVANTSPTEVFHGHVLVDRNLTPAGSQLRVDYSNLTGPQPPNVVTERPAGSVMVSDVTGTSDGPICTVEVTLRPMEAQVLARAST